MSFSSGSLLHYSYPCCYQSHLEFSLSTPTVLLFAAASVSTTSTAAVAAAGDIVARIAVVPVTAEVVAVLVQDF